MFKFSDKSLINLEGVHPFLVDLCHAAIKISNVDFMVFEGVRTIERQKQLQQRGVTRTLNSRHLTGHAVDLVPYIAGRATWDWDGCYEICDAMASVYRSRAYVDDRCIDAPRVRWGGAWGVSFFEIADAREARKRERANKKEGDDFADGVHFEIF